MNLETVNQRSRLSASDCFLLSLVALSFLVQIIYVGLSSLPVFLALVSVAAAAYFFSRRVYTVSAAITYKSTLWLMLPALALSVYRGARTHADWADLLIIGIFTLLVLSAGDDAASYEKALLMIRAFSVFYAITLWTQALLPGLYRAIVTRVFNASVLDRILHSRDSGYLTGLSTNAGFTAGHLCAGLFATYALNRLTDRKPDRRLFGFLFVSLLFTGKRAHIIFALLSLLFFYFLSYGGKNILKKYGKLFLLLAVLTVLFLLFRNLLVKIPGVARLVASMSGLLQDKDISSGRTELRAWALRTFFKYPLLGIGWGNAKLWSYGVVSFTAALDVHNVYVQLLCETGVVGFVSVCLVFAAFFRKTLRWKKAIASQAVSLPDPRWSALLDFSLLYQVFFLLYCFTGNPLYDHNFQMMYFFALALVAGLDYRMKVLGRARENV